MRKRIAIPLLAIFLALVVASPSLGGSLNGSAGQMPAFYDGNLFTIHFKLQPSSSTLIAQNKSINIIYMSTNPTTGQMFTSVLNALRGPGEGPGFNPLWQEVDIVFSNPNFAPQQFTSDNAILAATAAGEITLVPTNEVYECAVIGPG
jgi:hypothetical protein